MYIPAPHNAFLGLSPGPFEILLLLAAVLMLFGAKRVPEFARSLGKVMEELRRASQDFKSQLMEVEHEIQSEVEPFIHEPPDNVVNRIEEDGEDIDTETMDDYFGDEEGADEGSGEGSGEDDAAGEDTTGDEPEKPDPAS